MTFTPIEDHESQMAALQMILRAFERKEVNTSMPASGSRKDRRTGVRWNWRTRRKSGSDTILFENRFGIPSRSPVFFTVPLDVRDVNDGALIAQDSSGERYLCHLRYGKGNALGGNTDDPFAPGWTGRKYPGFDVVGKPSTRTYYACIPLDRGVEVILDELASFLDHISRLPETISRKAAVGNMSAYFQSNAQTYSPAEKVILKAHRAEIIGLLQNGIAEEDAFRTVLDEHPQS